MTAYYNEIDEYAAQWLRNLIAAGHIAPGDVDTRSITEVHPDDIKNYTQCHFFAGIGVWSYALRRAGWSDSRPVWTGSCPCQPFSTAGKGSGFDDERHLWPVFGNLIRKCRPATVFGEQVASKDADAWIDLVSADLEALDYAVGAVAFPSAGVGAPHIRDRTYWVANASGERVRAEGLAAPGATAQGMCGTDGQRERLWVDAGASSTNGADRMADAADQRQHGRRPGQEGDGRDATRRESERLCDAGGLAVANKVERRRRAEDAKGQFDWEASRRDEGNCKPAGRGNRGLQGSTDTGPVNSLWRDADWLLCRDGKWRPVEPGTFPLAHGITNRVGRLRAYGNAICAEAAVEFIKIAMDYRP